MRWQGSERPKEHIYDGTSTLRVSGESLSHAGVPSTIRGVLTGRSVSQSVSHS